MFVHRVLGVGSLCSMMPLALTAMGGCSSNGSDDGGTECNSDADCKGSRICEEGACVDPSVSSSGTPGPSGSGNGPGPGCGAAGDGCATQACCAGNSCVDFDEGAYCSADCGQGSDCVSGCCAPLEGGGSVCAPVEYCLPLKPLGVACASNAECASNDCIGWCTQTCGASSDCGDSAYCVTNEADQNVCFPSCGSTEHCSTFAGTTCQSGTSVEGFDISVCSS
jgi:hypothetical protein